jgi:hypothetical protein
MYFVKKDLKMPLRTGTVVGRYLVRHGLTIGKNMLDMKWDLRKDSEDSGRESPETWEQREMVVRWSGPAV